MSRIPLQDKKNILTKQNAKTIEKRTTKKPDTQSTAHGTVHSIDTNATSFIRLRHLTDKLSIQFYTDYAKSTFAHYKRTEYDARVAKSKNRQKLVEWLITVHHKLHLADETLYLTINIIDRMFVLRDIPSEKLPLLTVSSLFVASKYEEVTPPSLQTFVTLLNDQSENVLLAEKYLLCVLDYKLDYPQPLNFVRKCNKADNYNAYVRKVAKVLLEWSLVSPEITSLSGSVKACAAYLLARHVCGITENEQVFWYYCDEQKEKVYDCVRLYVDHLQAGMGDSMKRKYRSSAVIEKVLEYVNDL